MYIIRNMNEPCCEEENLNTADLLAAVEVWLSANDMHDATWYTTDVPIVVIGDTIHAFQLVPHHLERDEHGRMRPVSIYQHNGDTSVLEHVERRLRVHPPRFIRRQMKGHCDHAIAKWSSQLDAEPTPA